MQIREVTDLTDKLRKECTCAHTPQEEHTRTLNMQEPSAVQAFFVRNVLGRK